MLCLPTGSFRLRKTKRCFVFLRPAGVGSRFSGDVETRLPPIGLPTLRRFHVHLAFGGILA